VGKDPARGGGQKGGIRMGKGDPRGSESGPWLEKQGEKEKLTQPAGFQKGGAGTQSEKQGGVQGVGAARLAEKASSISKTGRCGVTRGKSGWRRELRGGACHSSWGGEGETQVDVSAQKPSTGEKLI